MDVVERLHKCEPAIRYKLAVNVLGENPASRKVKGLRKEIRDSERARALLARLTPEGIHHPPNVYHKWRGAHWIFAALADIGYPTDDRRLLPVRDQLQSRWLESPYDQEFEAKNRAGAYRQQGVPVMQGRHRRCASQQANALWSILVLGLENSATHELAERLIHWQWPDGGWNCDKNPDARHSSFMESILPLRALSLYANRFNHEEARASATRAAEVFLKRRLFLGERSGKVIKPGFTQLHYPLYWHYDILHGLKVMAETGFIKDSRCDAALDLLQDKALPAGGWPAEKAFYSRPGQGPANELVNWGGTSSRKMNPWTTVDALYVLRSAGRLT